MLGGQKWPSFFIFARKSIFFAKTLAFSICILYNKTISGEKWVKKPQKYIEKGE